MDRSESERLLGSLENAKRAKDLANDAAYSPAQYYRIVRRELNDRPMSARRRLLLERAAYELTRTEKSVTELAFDACFESLEGFSRSFKSAYGISPSAFRRLGPGEHRLDMGERLHFFPAVSDPRQGESSMNSVRRMIEHHCWSMERYLAACKSLSPMELEQPTSAPELTPWLSERPSRLSLIGKCCAFAAPWMESINGIVSDYEPRDPAVFSDTLANNRSGFFDIYDAIERDGSWDLTFVDAVCDPPEVFSYGGVIGHILTFASYRRLALIHEMKLLGFEGLGWGDPLEYDSRASAEPVVRRG